MNFSPRAKTTAGGAATAIVGLLIAGAAVAIGGCRDNTPPPPRVPVPAPQARRDEPVTYGNEREDAKPMPPQTRPDARLPYDDPPLVGQEPPEQPAFIDAYRHVGSPRITVFVSRDSDGKYDAADVRAIDYEAIETTLSDWLSCNGNVTIVSPAMARQRLSDQQVRDLEQGRANGLSDVAQTLNADILVRVQAHPTNKSQQDVVGMRIMAEAMNTRGGQSLGRAVADVPPPLEQTTINSVTRYLSRKLMDEMMATWSSPPPAAAPSAPTSAAPQTPPPVPSSARGSTANDNAAREMRPLPSSPPATQP